MKNAVNWAFLIRISREIGLHDRHSNIFHWITLLWISVDLTNITIIFVYLWLIELFIIFIAFNVCTTQNICLLFYCKSDHQITRIMRMNEWIYLKWLTIIDEKHYLFKYLPVIPMIVVCSEHINVKCNVIVKKINFIQWLISK